MRRVIKQIVADVLSRHKQRLKQTTDQVNALQEKITSLRAEADTIHRIVVLGTDTIDTAWNSHPQAREVFSRYHLHACHQCAVRFDETIQEAAVVYGFSEEIFVMELNKLLRRDL